MTPSAKTGRYVTLAALVVLAGCALPTGRKQPNSLTKDSNLTTTPFAKTTERRGSVQQHPWARNSPTKSPMLRINPSQLHPSQRPHNRLIAQTIRAIHSMASRNCPWSTW